MCRQACWLLRAYAHAVVCSLTTLSAFAAAPLWEATLPATARWHRLTGIGTLLVATEDGPLSLDPDSGQIGELQQLKEEFVKVLYAGMLAREMAGKAQVKDVEEAFIGAMLHNLGRMLAMFYFPEESAAIRQRVEMDGLSDARASIEVLGLSFENLGMGIARNWGFPDQLVQTMKTLPAGRVRKSANNSDRLQALAAFSNELCEIVLSTPDADRGQALAKLMTRFGDSLPVTEKQLAGLMEKEGFLRIIYEAGIMTELFPLLIFVGIGAMTDFGPLLENPKIFLLGAAGQFGIFLTLGLLIRCLDLLAHLLCSLLDQRHLADAPIPPETFG